VLPIGAQRSSPGLTTPLLLPDPLLGLLHLLNPLLVPLLFDPLLGLLFLNPLFTPLLLGLLPSLLFLGQPQIPLLLHPLLFNLPILRLLSLILDPLLIQLLLSLLLILALLLLLVILLLLGAPNIVIFHGDS
jgi:hypothetical protein